MFARAGVVTSLRTYTSALSGARMRANKKKYTKPHTPAKGTRRLCHTHTHTHTCTRSVVRFCGQHGAHRNPTDRLVRVTSLLRPHHRHHHHRFSARGCVVYADCRISHPVCMQILAAVRTKGAIGSDRETRARFNCRFAPFRCLRTFCATSSSGTHSLAHRRNGR